MSQEDILKYVKKYYPGHAIMLMTGFEKAFLGITTEGYRLPVAVYDFGVCAELLMETEQMTASEAIDHLQEIAANGTTIVITTHYIDEAGKANRVGLMRDGILLAEDTPKAVMDSQSTSSLEEAFLALCRREVKA